MDQEKFEIHEFVAVLKHGVLELAALIGKIQSMVESSEMKVEQGYDNLLEEMAEQDVYLKALDDKTGDLQLQRGEAKAKKDKDLTMEKDRGMANTDVLVQLTMRLRRSIRCWIRERQLFKRSIRDRKCVSHAFIPKLMPLGGIMDNDLDALK